MIRSVKITAFPKKRLYKQKFAFTLHYKVLSMKNQQYIDQLKDIREMMDRSSRFLSLSGMSGVLAGIYALIGAALAQNILYAHKSMYLVRHGKLESHFFESKTFLSIVVIAAGVLFLSVLTAVILSQYKAKKMGQSIWNKSSRRLLINFAIPLATGGIFGILLLRDQHYGLIAAVTLIFYGLALVNASKYTYETLRSLGIAFIVLGMLSEVFPGYGLYFWAAGFGLLHIIYGTYMYLKFDRKQPA